MCRKRTCAWSAVRVASGYLNEFKSFIDGAKTGVVSELVSGQWSATSASLLPVVPQASRSKTEVAEVQELAIR